MTATLLDLWRGSVTRDRLRSDGYVSICGSTDLLPWGYGIRYWVLIRAGDILDEVVEYVPREIVSLWTVDEDGERVPVLALQASLPRLVIGDFGRQAALHRCLGLPVSRPGVYWRPLLPRERVPSSPGDQGKLF